MARLKERIRPSNNTLESIAIITKITCQNYYPAEFSYNNAWYASIGCLLFYGNYDYNSRFTIELRQFSKHPIPTAKEMAKHLKSIYKDLTEFINITWNQQVRHYDAKYKHIKYKVGDKVWILL